MERTTHFGLCFLKKQKQNKKELLSPFSYLCLVFYLFIYFITDNDY